MDESQDVHLEVMFLLAYVRHCSLSFHSAGEQKVVLGKTAPGHSDVPQLGGMKAGTSASPNRRHVMMETALALDGKDEVRLS